MSFWRSLGPAVPRPAAPETLRAALGVALGLFLVGLGLAWAHPQMSQVLLIAPFGASAYLILAVPSSPLAQPWAVVVGNTVSALAALLILLLPIPGLAQAALAVALSVLLMALVRAQHPPGGAVALITVLLALAGHPAGWGWLANPVALGSALLVAFGMIWAALTGRSYPFRAPAAPPATHGTSDAAPLRRLAPSPQALAASLAQLRLAANIGVEDLARLIDRAESLSPDLAGGALPARAIMSRDVVAVSPETPLPDLAALFHAHGFKSLPVLDRHGHYLGLVRLQSLAGISNPQLTAADLTSPARGLPPEASTQDLIDLLADGRQEAVPILDGDRLEGLITRSDLIAALLHDLGLR